MHITTKAPSAPASVGVAQPAYIALKMIATTAKMGMVGGKGDQALAKRWRRDGPPELRPHRALPDDEGGVDEGGDHPRQESREDQGADRLLDDDCVDDEDRARGDEGGEGPPRRDHPGPASRGL